MALENPANLVRGSSPFFEGIFRATRDPCVHIIISWNQAQLELERRVHQQLHSLAQLQELQLATTNTLAQETAGDQVK